MALQDFHVIFLIFVFLEHAKEALDLAKMQEQTSQMEHQKGIKVKHLCS